MNYHKPNEWGVFERDQRDEFTASDKHGRYFTLRVAQHSAGWSAAYSYQDSRPEFAGGGSAPSIDHSFPSRQDALLSAFGSAFRSPAMEALRQEALRLALGVGQQDLFENAQ